MSGSANNKEPLWCLMNPSEQIKHFGLTAGEIKVYVSTIPFNKRHEWYVWHEGWSDWKALADVQEAHEMIEREVHPPELIVEEGGRKRVVSVHTGTHSTSPGLGLSVGPVEGQTDSKEFVVREFERYQKRMRVVIESQGQHFESFTKDVSVGGVQIEDHVPEWVFGYCKLLLHKLETNEVLELTCSLVEEDDSKKRNRLALAPMKTTEDSHKLDSWLAA